MTDLQDETGRLFEELETVKEQIPEDSLAEDKLYQALERIEDIHYTVQNSRKEFRTKEVEAE